MKYTIFMVIVLVSVFLRPLNAEDIKNDISSNNSVNFLVPLVPVDKQMHFVVGAGLSRIIAASTGSLLIGFVIATTVCFLFTMSGLDLVLNFFKLWAPEFLVDTISSMSFLTHFDSITKGVIEIRDFLFYLSVIIFWIFLNIMIIEYKKFN